MKSPASANKSADALAVRTNVTDEKQVRQLARRAAETYGRIDARVNDSAVTMPSRFEDAPANAFRRVTETNFFGYIFGAREVLPHFRKQGYGVLVNAAFVEGKVAAPYPAPCRQQVRRHRILGKPAHETPR